jgi:hypothetical protein
VSSLRLSLGTTLKQRSTFGQPLQVLNGSKADPDASGIQKKRPNPAAGLSDADVVQHTAWKDLLSAGQLKSKTVDTLKQYCRHYKLATSGKKADLLERVSAHILQTS